jgi:hypothetical protein
MTDRELMQQALDALEYIYTETTEAEDKLIHAATTALRDRLAQPELTIDGKTVAEFGLTELFEFQEATGCDTAKQFREKQATQQEPVKKIEALLDNDCSYAYADGWNACVDAFSKQRRPWVGLTDQELQDAFYHVDYDRTDDFLKEDPDKWCQEFYKRIDRLLEAKNK